MVRRRVAIFGGSFNPPHVAHQMVCLWALSTGRADEVWMVPCFEHAFDKALVAYEHRREMCELAAASFPTGAVQVSAIEAELGGKSRTFVTVSSLCERYPDRDFSLLIGADLVPEIASWHRADELRELVDLIVVGRSGYEGPSGSAELAAISSTKVRGALRKGADVSGWLPSGVVDYISRHGLYQDTET
ncbi:MAG: nicotinate (nicotinamide) nucleotide adenylyltransferase [Deltaproteobacteria bacterium]|nr:nicotinate (nicotinamide) nucleotide adenylyltransferase [Deltaproteobacteria bacterium]